MRGKGEGSIWERERGVFVARLTVGYNARGNPRRITKTFVSKKAAAAWLADQQVKLAGGQLAEPGRVTVRAWVAQYLDGLSIRENTRHDYDKALGPVLDDLGDVRLRDLTPARVQAQLNTWTKTRTAYQNRKTMRALKAALSEATRLELLPRNPAAPVRLPRVERGTILVWTGQEAAQVLGHAREQGHRLHAYLHVNLTTGLRREEMLGLRWQDVDLAGHALRVRQTCTYITGKPSLGPPKTRAGRWTVALDEETVRVLADWRVRLSDTRKLAKGRWREHDLVFPSSIRPPAKVD